MVEKLSETLNNTEASADPNANPPIPTKDLQLEQYFK